MECGISLLAYFHFIYGKPKLMKYSIGLIFGRSHLLIMLIIKRIDAIYYVIININIISCLIMHIVSLELFIYLPVSLMKKPMVLRTYTAIRILIKFEYP